MLNSNWVTAFYIDGINGISYVVTNVGFVVIDGTIVVIISLSKKYLLLLCQAFTLLAVDWPLFCHLLDLFRQIIA